MSEIAPGDVLDGAVPLTETLKDNRRARIKSIGRPPSQLFLKENMLQNEEVAIGDSEKVNETDQKQSLGVIKLNDEVVKTATISVPPWLEELRKKKQVKGTSSDATLQKTNFEEKNIVKERPQSLTVPEDKSSQEENRFVSHVQKKTSFWDEEREKVNTTLVINDSCDIEIPAGRVNFIEGYGDDCNEEITEVMSPVDLERKSSEREIFGNAFLKTHSMILQSPVTLGNASASLSFVKPLTRSESLNRHQMQTSGKNNSAGKSNSTEQVNRNENGNDDTKIRLTRIVEQLENTINKNISCMEILKKKAEASIDENKKMKKSVNVLKTEIGRLI